MASPQARWWERYDDPVLSALIERALRKSYTLRSRFASIRRAEALRREASAARWPTVNAQLAVSRNRSVGFFGANVADRVDLSVPIAYEVDLFARFASEAHAREDELRATALVMESAAISLSAEVAEAWYDVVTARARVRALEVQRETNATYLALVKLRYRRGLGEAVDVRQQEQQVEGTLARLAEARGRLFSAGQQLAILLGDTAIARAGRSDAPRDPPVAESAPDAAEGDGLPELGAPPAAGVPADLVASRPDVRAARHRIEAADRRIGSLLAEQLPSLRVEFLPGWQWFQTDARSQAPDGSSVGIPPAQGFVWAGSATMNVPLFDGLAALARTNAQRARLDEQIENFAALLLDALMEVEGALVLERRERERLAHLEAQARAADSALEASRARYRAGLSDFLPVLTALQSAQSTELQILDSKRQVLSQRIQLHRALGGGWAADLQAPEPTRVRGERS
ncbi:MAG: TolC family protein [Myxococcota bacterium]